MPAGKIEWYNPETGQVELLDDPDYHESPYEKAHREGHGEEFDRATEWFYNEFPTGEVPSDRADADTNWYNQNTWPLEGRPDFGQTPPAGPTGGPGPKPTVISDPPPPGPPVGGGTGTRSQGGVSGPSTGRSTAALRFTQPRNIPDTDLPSYTPFTFPTYSFPDYSLEEGLVQKHVKDMLENPYSLSDLDVAKLKERQKEEALGYEKQIVDKLRQTAASRNALYGGHTAAGERRVASDMASQVLKGNRDIDIDVAGRRFGERQAAVEGANRALDVMGGRKMLQNQFDLGLQGAKASEHRYQQEREADKTRFALQRALAKEGFNLDVDRFLDDTYRFENTFREGQRQFNEGLGFNYSQLSQMAYQNWLNSVLAGTRR